MQRSNGSCNLIDCTCVGTAVGLMRSVYATCTCMHALCTAAELALRAVVLSLRSLVCWQPSSAGWSVTESHIPSTALVAYRK